MHVKTLRGGSILVQSYTQRFHSIRYYAYIDVDAVSLFGLSKIVTMATWVRVCVFKCTVTIGPNPAEKTTLRWPQPSLHTLMLLAQESHVVAHVSRYWSACSPTYQSRASGQSHFQQINLIWKFSSPCNLEQQQQGPDSPPTLGWYLPPHVFPLLYPVLTEYGPLSERRTWETEGWMGVRKRKREGKRDGEREAGNYFQRSFC